MNDELRRDTQPGPAAGEERRADGWGSASEGPAMGGGDRPPQRPALDAQVRLTEIS